VVAVTAAIQLEYMRLGSVTPVFDEKLVV